MVGGVLLLAIAIFGILVMFGKTDAKRILWLVPILICLPIVASIGFSYFTVLWDSVSLVGKVFLLFGGLFVAYSLVRWIFPKSKILESLLEILGRAFVSIVAFPIRLLYRVGLLVFDRERRPQRLARRRRSVGGPPPLESDRRRR